MTLGIEGWLTTFCWVRGWPKMVMPSKYLTSSEVTFSTVEPCAGNFAWRPAS